MSKMTSADWTPGAATIKLTRRARLPDLPPGPELLVAYLLAPPPQEYVVQATDLRIDGASVETGDGRQG